MNRLVRALSMTIGLLLLLHYGAMAADPVGMHTGADEPVVSMMDHANHDTVDPSHAESHTAHGKVVSAGTCMETEGVASQTRVQLDPVAFTAVLPSPLSEVIPAESSLLSSWSPPVLDGRDLRVFLQVFLN